jgi:hypothetical protein
MRETWVRPNRKVPPWLELLALASVFHLVINGARLAVVTREIQDKCHPIDCCYLHVLVLEIEREANPFTSYFFYKL